RPASLLDDARAARSSWRINKVNARGRLSRVCSRYELAVRAFVIFPGHGISREHVAMTHENPEQVARKYFKIAFLGDMLLVGSERFLDQGIERAGNGGHSLVNVRCANGERVFLRGVFDVR